MPKLQRDVLLLVGALGHTYVEAGDICNCVVGTVKSRASRARESLSLRTRTGDRYMTREYNPFSRPLRPSEIGMRGEINAKWSKIRSQEIADLNSNDDLVEQVRAKYGLQRGQAQREVNTFVKGRQLKRLS